MRFSFSHPGLFSLSLLLGGCASLGGGTYPAQNAQQPAPAAHPATLRQAVDEAARTQKIVGQPSAFERDRAAILAMQGEYAVRFGFAETVALQAGYAPRPAKTTDAYEVVVLIADDGRQISLQHLLQTSEAGGVIKHWRQDWHYEAGQRWEFSDDQTWTLVQLAPEQTRGRWTQCVYEVSDAPRYCGTGRWRHQYGTPTWTSDRAWRPLPRREYTQRDDYNALNVENRHSITPSGWTHEQDNTKVVRGPGQTTLVREFGFNDYRRISDFDFGPAYAYWERTAGYWAAVRSEWEQRIQRQAGITLRTPVDGMAIIGPLFAQAARVQADQPAPVAEIRAVLEQYTAAPGVVVGQLQR